MVFRITKVGVIAGSYILDGEIRRGSKARVIRAGTLVHESEVSSLKHLQEDVREIRQGFECGIGIKGFSDFMVGDRIESYVVERVQVA
jgi:translation initiation factor IF-2